MKGYESPVIQVADAQAEAVYLASGAVAEKQRCRFGKTEANQGRDQCQVCSATGGQRNTALADEHFYEGSYKGCPDNMPEK